MGTKYTNADGLVQNYGTHDAENNLTRRSGGNGAIQTLKVAFTYDNLVGYDQDASGGSTPDRFGEAQAFIPANSYIKSATLICTTDWATSDSADLTLGLYQKDNTVIDADGIDATIAATALDLGDVVLCDGALVGGTVYVGANDAYVRAAIGTGAFTTGAATLVIEYITP